MATSPPQVHGTADVAEYAAAAVAFLEEEPCARSVLRSVVEYARAGGTSWTAEPRFWWVSEGGTTVGAAHWTPPYGLHASILPVAAAEPLVAAVHADSVARDLHPSGVMAPAHTAAALAVTWTRLTGEQHRESRRLLLHELERVVEPPRPSGRPRPATERDTDLLVRWLDAFVVETGVSAGADPRASTARTIAQGTLDIWEDGEPVSFVNRTLPTAGVVRIGPVYTPPERRGRGYARALTAHSSRRGLDAGARWCMLYTDAANPVSNAIYSQIGYIAMGEHTEYALG